MKIRNSIFYFLLTVCSVTTFAQQQSELKTLIQESFNYFPKLKELEQSEQMSASRLRSTQSNQMPNVNGSVSYNYVNPVGLVSFPVGPGVYKDLQFQPNNNYNANIAVNYVLLDFGRLKAAVEKSKEDLNYSKQNLEYNKAQLAAQVAGIYYYLVYLKKAVVIQDSVIAYYKQNRAIVQSRIKNGDALQVDLLNIDASVDNEQNKKVDLLNAIQKQLNLLEYTTGKTDVNGSEFNFVIKEESLDNYMKAAETKNAEFALMRSRMLQAQSDVRYNKRQLAPTLNATANAGIKNGYQPDIFQARFNYLAGVSLNVPIYSGGKNSAQIALAEQTLKQTEYSLSSLNNTCKKDIRQALTDIESNKERLKNAESQNKSAQAVMELTESRFKNGVATYLDLTYAATGLQRASLSILQYQYQLCLAKIELARLTGENYW